MKAIELEKAYDPKTFETRIYSLWKDSGAFKPEAAKGGGTPYVIVIPPPNVTGVLHLGHGLNNSLQDIIIRYHRMRGVPTLWVPGTDHAGIATQHVVERKLKERGTSRRELGREKFLEETWKVKGEHHAIITEQLKRIGASVDWDRERFTLDEGLVHAVREVFVTLYERDLLYKGNYLVNWCTTCGTALADDEVDHEDTPGTMYRLRYYFANDEGNAARNAAISGEAPAAGDLPGGKFVEIATTRPETLLGDTAVAVHPEDERYAGLKGKSVRLPLAGRDIPVVFDAYVDRAFGTGVVKITPAHDPNDWDVAGRHGLPVINILNSDGTLNGEVPEKYRGMPVKKARAAVLEDLKAGGWYVTEENIKHAVGHCYRCHTVIEPFLSEQWFVRMKPLAEKALVAWQRGEIIFYPRKWEHTYRHWMENIRDWCISRQLWWGHRIPAWDCADCGKTSVSRNDLSSCPHCGSANIEQDPDVLDTWFSSWLWPFSTLGWGNGRMSNDKCEMSNEEKERHSPLTDFTRYYPTTALITAYDIIFFWVARMIMAGLEFTGKAPFRDVYIHGLVRDKQGRKMSKSLGNGLDPLELVDEFGADAMKFTLAFMCAQGQDVLVDRESFKMGSRFANKVWNASRFILMNLEGRSLIENPALLPVDTWIYSRLNSAAKAMEEAFLSYRYNDAALTAYEYFWNDFCDWYVEASKLSVRTGEDSAHNAAEKDRAATVLLGVLAESLKLLHPLLPFVTEEIYGKLPNADGLLITSPYPQFDERRSDNDGERRFAFLQELVRMIRTLRSECTITPDKKLRVLVRAIGEQEETLRHNEALVKLLAGINVLEVVSESASMPIQTLEFASDQGSVQTPRLETPAIHGGESSVVDGAARPEGSIGMAGAGFEVFVFIAEAVDIAALKRKFAKDLERDQGYIQGLRSKLANEQFVKNAPPELVAAEKAKLEAGIARCGKIESYLRDL
ncbi:MAG: valine--tRNA ligase [Treponema sp.]|nr:valine--tRNA ligase [Treponema sp.]